MQLNLDLPEENTVSQRGHATRWRDALERQYASRLVEEPRLAPLVSYVGNKKIPLLRLYRYKEAFAFAFVEESLERLNLQPADTVLDPFCGMGTTPFVSGLLGIPAIGVDKLPVATFIARTLPSLLGLEPGCLYETFLSLSKRVGSAPPAPVADDVAIMRVAFPDENLFRLRQWKQTIETLEPPLKHAFQLFLLGVLEACSFTAKDGQFLRLNPRKQPHHPDEALQQKVVEAEHDIQIARKLGWHLNFRTPQIIEGDARTLSESVDSAHPTVIITSPPYANRYDYTRTYSLELCFYFVNSFEELKKLRFGILRSHIEAKVDIHESASHYAVQEVVTLLRQRTDLNNPRIPDMLTGYFVDMEQVVREWARVLPSGGKVIMVVDNVRFEGEMVPVDLILCDIAERYGFCVDSIAVARYKGNSSQQMGRYGRVPVRESVLYWTKR